ncbi:MAG: DMT family transporter [Pseudomonadota bacterium]
MRPATILVPALFVVLWSTGFVGAKFGLPYAEPMTFLGLRFTLAAIALALVALALGEWRKVRDAKGAALIGVFIHGVYLGGVFYAIFLGLGAAMAALVVSLQPVMTAILARTMLGERLIAIQWIGVALGVAGVALAVWRKLGDGEISAASLSLCVAGLAAISYATILQKRRGVTALAADGAMQFAAAAAFCAILAIALETNEIRWTTEFFLALGWMVFVLSLGAMTLLYLMLRRGEASRIASLFFLVPAVTALMAWAMFGELFGAFEIAGLVVAGLGVALVTQAPRAS